MLSIQAKMDRKSDDGSRFYQEVHRDYLLPETLKIDELKSIFTDDGVSLWLLFPSRFKKKLICQCTRCCASKRLSRKQRNRRKFQLIVVKFQKKNTSNNFENR